MISLRNIYKMNMNMKFRTCCFHDTKNLFQFNNKREKGSYHSIPFYPVIL